MKNVHPTLHSVNCPTLLGRICEIFFPNILNSLTLTCYNVLSELLDRLQPRVYRKSYSLNNSTTTIIKINKEFPIYDFKPKQFLQVTSSNTNLSPYES